MSERPSEIYLRLLKAIEWVSREEKRMDDLISRQAAIDAVRGRFSMPVDNLIVEVIGNLPSAQPVDKDIDVRSTDTISRQSAIDALLHNQEVYSNNFGDDAIDKYTVAIIDNDAQTIAQLPSVQPERKKGKWIDVWRSAFDGTRHWHRECSECGYERDDDSIDKDTRFCPNCGAEMRGEANEGTVH